MTSAATSAWKGRVLFRAARVTGMLAMVRAVVLADTHAPRRWRGCPPAVAQYLRKTDLILHAGLLHIEDGRLVEARIVAVDT